MDTTLVRQTNMAVQTPSEQEAVALIDQAHLRSQAFGLSTHDRPDHSSAAIGHVKDALEENRFLFQHAVPVMETLYGQIATPTAWCC